MCTTQLLLHILYSMYMYLIYKMSTESQKQYTVRVPNFDWLAIASAVTTTQDSSSLVCRDLPGRALLMRWHISANSAAPICVLWA